MKSLYDTLVEIYQSNDWIYYSDGIRSQKSNQFPLSDEKEAKKIIRDYYKCGSKV